MSLGRMSKGVATDILHCIFSSPPDPGCFGEVSSLHMMFALTAGAFNAHEAFIVGSACQCPSFSNGGFAEQRAYTGLKMFGSILRVSYCFLEAPVLQHASIATITPYWDSSQNHRLCFLPCALISAFRRRS